MANKNPDNMLSMAQYQRRVRNHFGVGDIVDVPEGHRTVRAKIVGVYPYIVRYRNVETGFCFCLTMSEAANVTMVRRVSGIS